MEKEKDIQLGLRSQTLFFRGAAPEMNREKQVTLSLISHTNVGKTTLARTLLRRDIGEILDRAHVTDISEAHSMLRLETGEELLLWDTPGFGDTARLLRRLKISDNPIGWILSQVWDRFLDRPLWCSQQAVRNVRDEADIVLYLVNAAEDPSEAGYVRMEMEILDWIGKPVLVLLNQTGPPRTDQESIQDEEIWRAHLKDFAQVKDVLSMDAFTRCWVQEGLLLGRIGQWLPENKQPVFDPLAEAWALRNWEIFRESIAVLSRSLAEAVCDREPFERASVPEKIRSLLARESLTQEQRAMALMAERQSRNIAEGTNALIRLHGLDGQAAVEILQWLKSDYAKVQPLDEGVATVVGACLSGALAGLGADVLAGGLTVGGGAILGGILGALGAKGIAKGYNLVRGEREPFVRCSAALFETLVQSALLRYLAVAHFGRGRGDFVGMAHPKTWLTVVADHVTQQRDQWLAIWGQANGTDAGKIDAQIRPVLQQCAWNILCSFYPRAVDRLGAAQWQ